MSTRGLRQRLARRLSAAVGTSRLPSLETHVNAMEWRLEMLEKQESYDAVAKLSDRYARGTTAPCADLRLSEMRVFSQNGEDGVICALVNLLDVKEEFFVEFGVGDGTECNTRFLAEVLGWSGAYFEIEPNACDRLNRRYANTDRIAVTNVAVTPENIGGLFESSGVPYAFGVLSIDVDGQDVWLWRALPREYRPAVVVIEYNAGLDRESPLAEPLGTYPALTSMFGASLGALDVVAEEKGYRLVHTEIGGVNAFYVRGDLAEAAGCIRGLVDRSPNYHGRGIGHVPDRSGRELAEVRPSEAWDLPLEHPGQRAP